MLLLSFFGALAYPLARYAWRLPSQIRAFRTHFLHLDDTGLRLNLPDLDELQLPWNEVQGVTCEKKWVEPQGIAYLSAYKLLIYRIQTTPRRVRILGLRNPAS